MKTRKEWCGQVLGDQLIDTNPVLDISRKQIFDSMSHGDEKEESYVPDKLDPTYLKRYRDRYHVHRGDDGIWYLFGSIATCRWSSWLAIS